MRERVFELARAKMHDDEIAAVLTNEGHRSPNCAEKVLPVTVQRIRLLVGVKQAAPRTRGRHPLSVLNAQEFARMLNIPVNWLYVQIEKGTHLFVNTPTVIGAVGKLQNHELEDLDLRIGQPEQEGHQHA